MKIILRILKWAAILFFGSSILVTVLYRWVPVRTTPLMVIRAMANSGDSVYTDWKHRWVPLDSISPYMPVAVMASEDQRFPEHHGFDFEAIRQAQAEYEAGGRRRGASTISQQTAKNVYLWPQSSWLRKGLEAYFTVLIELTWSKRRIMEVYLNSIEMGPGIYGIESVAQAHFHCHASELSRSQCALIAATLPNPRRFSSAHPSRYMRKRQHQIERQMKHIPFLEK